MLLLTHVCQVLEINEMKSYFDGCTYNPCICYPILIHIADDHFNFTQGLVYRIRYFSKLLNDIHVLTPEADSPTTFHFAN